MKFYIYILMLILSTACQNKQNENKSTDSQNDEIRKMIEEDSFVIDTNIRINKDEMDLMLKKSLTEIALKPLKPKYKISDLSIEKVLIVYQNLAKTIEKYKDSSENKQMLLDALFEDLEIQNEKLEQSEDYPIELKLEVASIKSDIHFLRSNRQLKSK